MTKGHVTSLGDYERVHWSCFHIDKYATFQPVYGKNKFKALKLTTHTLSSLFPKHLVIIGKQHEILFERLHCVQNEKNNYVGVYIPDNKALEDIPGCRQWRVVLESIP